MTQDRVGKSWTKDEDELLIQAVAVHGEVDNWKTVALSVPGRTNKACRKRWLHSLSPSVKKTAWTPEEDKLLLTLYALHGTKWSVIARGIPGRTDDACSKRYREALDPTLKKDDWTSEEEDRLLQVYARLGGKWGQVGHELNRSGLACRNRWRLLQRRKAANNSQTGQQTLNSTAGPSAQQPTPLASVTPSAWISSLPAIDPAQLWNARSAGYYEPIDYHTQEHNYPPTAFGPHLDPVGISNGIHSGSSTPPPFQFSSSSLSAALSISRPANNVPGPSHHHNSEPQNQSTSPPSHRPSSIDGEPLHPTPSYSPEPHHHELEFEAQPPSGDNEHYEDNNMPPLFDDFEQDLEQPSPTQLGPPGPYPSGPRPDEGHESEPPPPQTQTVDSAASQEQGPRSVSIPTSDSVSTQQQSSQASSSTSAETDRAQDTPTAQLDPSRHYRTEAEKARKAVQQRKPKDRSGPPPRLSSTLSVSTDVLAYACGHEDCWPSSAAEGSYRFATSRELSDHWKIEHASAIVNSQPFRCALTGCGRGWKSLNGLQYHLQVSKVHFQQALSATAAVSTQSEGPTDAEDAPSAANKGKKVKVFKCTHPNCMHQYRQKSGLRYHLTHGHLDHNGVLPAQLDVVPPTLARKVAQVGQSADSESVPARN